MIWLESLTPKRRFTADSKRSPSCEATESTPPDDQQRPGFPEPERRKAARHRKAGDKAADSPRPGLFGADARPEFRAADAAAGEIAAAIGHPHDDQHEHQRGKALDRIEAQQHRRHLGHGGIEKSRRAPVRLRRRDQRDRTKPTPAPRARHRSAPSRGKARPRRVRRRPTRSRACRATRPTTISHST